MTQETTSDVTAEPDWVSNAVDSIVDVVDTARTKGTENAIVAARGVVFGLLASAFALAALVLVVVILVRLADAYLPIGSGVGDATWAAYLFIGGLLSILGFGMWASRKTEGTSRVVLAAVLDLVIVVVIVCYGIFS
jgi:hypothetical protein